MSERKAAGDVKNRFQTELNRTDCEGAWLRLQTEEWGYRGKFKSKGKSVDGPDKMKDEYSIYVFTRKNRFFTKCHL